ncbi:MAG: hypothetical protein F6K28_30045 [Microcoleus sp. SIO2G3]|nr:hypothetical protein [Microcoleus sp. SIO2G3]
MSAFKVMTWNVENLFRPGGDSGPKTDEAFAKKLSSLAEVILKLDPDVLALQEVGGEAPLADLADALEGRYSHSKLSEHPDRRGIRVGFLSKLAIELSDEVVTFPATGLPAVPGIDEKGSLVEATRMSRGALRIVVKPTPDLSVHLIVGHLKSKLLSFPGRRFDTNDENERARIAGIALLQRTAESVALRVKANEILQQQPKDGLIVLGDLNDVTDAATTQILQGPSGSEIGTRGFNSPDKGDDARLFNLAPLIASERRFSRIHKGNPELIDHILISEQLLPGQPRRLPTVDSHVDLVGALPSIGDDPKERQGKPSSDHAPVTAAFEL